VSAQECAASARIDADPVTTAAIVFANATRTFEARAMTTVVVLASEPAVRARLMGREDLLGATACSTYEVNGPTIGSP
jgi:hypothetical protein